MLVYYYILRVARRQRLSSRSDAAKGKGKTMTVSDTHNEFRLSVPPGTRFAIWGADVVIEFERGREDEVIAYLRHWLDYLEENKTWCDPRIAALVKAKHPESAANVSVSEAAQRIIEANSKVICEGCRHSLALHAGDFPHICAEDECPCKVFTKKAGE
jgi:hypothetical protein